MAYNSHGHTPAAWTTVTIVLAGLVVGAVAVIAQNWPLFWIGGAGLVVLAGIVGKVMQMMGLGQIDTHDKRPGHDSAVSSQPAAASAADGDSPG